MAAMMKLLVASGRGRYTRATSIGGKRVNRRHGGSGLGFRLLVSSIGLAAVVLGACFPDPPECVGANTCPDGETEIEDGGETSDAVFDGVLDDTTGDLDGGEDIGGEADIDALEIDGAPEVEPDTQPETAGDTATEVIADTAPDDAPEIEPDTTVVLDTITEADTAADTAAEVMPDVEVDGAAEVDHLECDELDCELEQRACIEGTAASDARCGECLAEFREDDGECVPVRTCADLACALEHRACTERSGETDAFCGGCLGGYRPSGGVCVAIVTCAALDCDAAHRDCDEASEVDDAVCTSCLAGYAEVGDACLATAPAPVGVAATTDEAELVEIVWDPVDNALGYDVYRCDQPTCSGGSAGWFVLNEDLVTDTSYIDDTVEIPPSPAAPSGTSATQDDPTKVTVTWAEVSVPAATRYRYRVVAVSPGGESPASSAVTGHVLDRPVTGYELAVDPSGGGAWTGIALGTTQWVDSGAPAPSVTAPIASATQGVHEDYVRLTASGGSVTAGATRQYAVRATTTWGPGPSAAATGRRPAGSLGLQWERSAGTSPSGFTAIAGATATTYDDHAAPSDGATRWYRVLASAEGAASVASDPVAGSRLDPTSVVPTGVSASADRSNDVEIRWNPVAGATGYLVYRCDAATCGATSGWTALTGVPTTSASYVDATVAVPAAPGAPTAVSATNDDGLQVAVSWGAASVPEPKSYRYRVTAMVAAGESDPSDVVQGQVAPRPVSGWEIRVDGGAWLPVAGGAAAVSYIDAGAPAPTVSAATASASQGTIVAHVALTASGAFAADGAPRTYDVRALNASGAGTAGTASGRRAAGAIGYQWERSSGTTASGFSAIAGAASASFDDTGAPADGSVRWYRVVTSTPGAGPATSEAVSGHRLGPPAAAPGGVQATSDVEGYVRVTWQAVSGASSYVVRRDGQVIAQSVTALVHDDVTAPEPAAWGAPTNVAATTNQSTQVTVTWTAPTQPLGALASYTVAALNAAGEGPASSGVQGRKARPAIEGFEVAYGATSMGSWVGTGATSTTWNHTDAPLGSVTGGTASASQGTNRSVQLSVTGGAVNAAPTQRYWVRGALVGGGATPASASYATGQIAVGSLARQWQRSSGTTASSFSDLSGATGTTYADGTAPSDGAHRWYRVVLSAPGATAATTTAVEGWRLAFVDVVAAGGVALIVPVMFTCAVTPLATDGGRVWCWGYNKEGQLGRGSASTEPGDPARIENLSGVVGLASGVGHICALTSGAVWCWGSNASGQLGLGDEDHRFVPTQVSGVTATQIAAGSSTTCAVLTSGQVRCWGAGTSGVLGNDASDDSAWPVAVQTAPGANLTGVVSVAIGDNLTSNHACAVRSNGTVWCWGSNSDGQLGRSTPASSDLALQATNITNALTIAAGIRYTCARFGDSALKCWGDNDDPNGGVFGDGSTGSDHEPHTVSLQGAIDLSVGFQHGCARTSASSTNNAWCWGVNTNGSLGSGSSAPAPYPVSVNHTPSFARLSAGVVHSCGVSGDVVYCWGSNDTRNLGDGTTNARTSPTLTLLP